jgi:hypothetical protein
MSKIDYNTHLVSALSSITFHTEDPYVDVNESVVSFNIQEGPIKENGRNGCDATDIIRYAIGLYRSFNSAHPCRENSITITRLEEALHWQEARTRDRSNRGVEGTNAD